MRRVHQVQCAVGGHGDSLRHEHVPAASASQCTHALSREARSRRSATPRCWSSSTRPRSSSWPPLRRQHGFSGVMAADHFQPWIPQQGQASFVWNVLSALGQKTTGDLGTGVTAPTFRMHPAMVAQASATLAAMYPQRHWLGLGSGEALNEHVVGAILARRPRAHQPHVRGRRHHQEAVRVRPQRQGRPPRGPVLPPRIHPPLDDARAHPRHPGRRIRSRHREARRPHRRRAHHRGRPARQARHPAHPLRRGRQGGRPRRRARCRRCCACT